MNPTLVQAYKITSTAGNDTHAHFDENHVLHELKHFLPSQQALKDFIHHNSLHAFQHMKFYDAIFKASKIFGFQVHLQLDEYRELYKTGRIREDVLLMIIENKKESVSEWKDRLLYQEYDTINQPRIGQLRKLWKSVYRIDLDNKVHPLLFRILCAFLDQGIAVENFPVSNKSFTDSIKELEKNSPVSFFKTRSVRQKFLSGNYSTTELLQTIVGDEAYFEQYLFDQQFAHHGWSGFVSAVEDTPHTLLDRKIITLRELVEFELLLELDALNAHFRNNWEPLVIHVDTPPIDLLADIEKTELAEVIELWQDAFEWSYYDSVLKGIQLNDKKKLLSTNGVPQPLSMGNGVPAVKQNRGERNPSFQAIFCIDERECSLRRHIEAVDKNCETFGAPGFFGVEFYFQQQGSKFYDKLCPAPVTPKYLIKEFEAKTTRKGETLYTKHTHGFLTGFALSISLGFWAFIKTVLNLFKPAMSPAISNAYGHMDRQSVLTIENKNADNIENGLQVGYTIDEMATRAEGFLKSIGLIKNFAPVIYIVAHGSSSANNPHHGAHDCGACSGRPGATNARVQAFILNHQKVREILQTKGIVIPGATQFIGSMHDTAADVIGYYDEQPLTEENLKSHFINKQNFETALNLNAKERSRRFASIDTRRRLEHVRKAIHNRSVSLFEPRPELGHGTNTLAIIGRRETTKGLFLDRRAFLNSYDYTTDPDGTILTGVMKPIGLVCGGINLEYYFSRVDNIKMGAGTKLPHNVMGLFGVANSSDGDLRPGLPWQMIEVHDPVRLLVIVEHQPDIVLKAIQSSPEVFEWYKNEWVHIVSFHPEEKQFYYFHNGSFSKYEPITDTAEIKTIRDMEEFVENAKEMETNHIVHATEENLPVYLLD
ncbi:YbcC family protein [Terrimonas alba]|uniref:YbcC family protein n=1 Tax=Terrimonas alba TaxID=3349636 RepID=UPI0035F3383F